MTRRERKQIGDYAGGLFREEPSRVACFPGDMKNVFVPCLTPMMEINGTIKKHVVMSQRRPRIPLIYRLIYQEGQVILACKYATDVQRRILMNPQG